MGPLPWGSAPQRLLVSSASYALCQLHQHSFLCHRGVARHRKPILLPFSKLTVGTLLQVLLETNTAGNLQLVVQVAKEYTEQLGAGKIMELLEGHKSYHGLYYYLGGHIAFSEDPEVGFYWCIDYFPVPSSATSVTHHLQQGLGAQHAPLVFWQAGRPQAAHATHASSRGNSALSRDCKACARPVLIPEHPLEC